MKVSLKIIYSDDHRNNTKSKIVFLSYFVNCNASKYYFNAISSKTPSIPGVMVISIHAPFAISLVTPRLKTHKTYIKNLYCLKC